MRRPNIHPIDLFKTVYLDRQSVWDVTEHYVFSSRRFADGLVQGFMRGY
jgi:hypothetical protein